MSYSKEPKFFPPWRKRAPRSVAPPSGDNRICLWCGEYVEVVGLVFVEHGLSERKRSLDDSTPCFGSNRSL